MPVPPAPSATSDATESNDGAVAGGEATSSGAVTTAATNIVPPATAVGRARRPACA